MSFIPAWAPNVHPLLVHFPIALLLSAATVDVIAWLLRSNRRLRDAATLLYLIGTLGALAAYFSGRAASYSVWLPGMAHGLVKDHWDWAYRLVWFFGTVTILRLVLLRSSSRHPAHAIVAAFALAGLVGIWLVRETGDRGGQLVYQYRVGVPEK
jgi:uncharacterized membrane protein